ncbi:hypothetical protein F4778DRAFT_781819 [Xylariomycetidae sp. FL2044]|nr:hypothetical protein F4778DRAFT_781819 [Xylariomycetidae sp. FL2044]
MESEHDEVYIPESITPEWENIFQNIQALYDAGTPFFTKDNMQKVGEQLQHFLNGEREHGGKMTAKGVNGIDYEVSVHSPVDYARPGEYEVHGGARWEIAYRTLDTFTTFPLAAYFGIPGVYLPMMITPVRRFVSKDDETIHHINEPPAPLPERFDAYKDMERQWRSSQHYGQLQELLATIKIPFTLTRAVALALGPLTVGSIVLEHRVHQHALVSALHPGLIVNSPELFVQDPGYAKEDEEVLRLAGFTVLGDPQAFLELDESSVLISINHDAPVEDIVVDICRPGIIIWNREGRLRPFR